MTMSLISVTLKHGQTEYEAQQGLEAAVNEVRKLFGVLIQQVTWSTDRNEVRLDGTGFWIEMVIDAQNVYATGDIPALGGLLGGPLTAGIKQILRRNFPKQLP